VISSLTAADTGTRCSLKLKQKLYLQYNTITFISGKAHMR